MTFPHLFKPFTATGGRWPGSEAETYGLLRFAFAHPEIAMTFVFGATNTCIAPPQGGRKGSVDFTQIKVPEDMAKRVGLDPTRMYTMQEIIDFVRPMAPPGFEITESVVASFLGLGAVVNPLEDDVKLYKELSERYKEYLKAAKLDGKRLEPAQARDGSPELWSYYHLGVPTFSMDLWTPPESADESKEKTGITADTLEAMTGEAFVALGEAKVEAFLKEVGAPPDIKAADLIAGVKGGQMTPKQMAGMLRQMPKPPSGEGGDPRQKALLAWSDKELGGKGFVNWTPFKHPTLGEVEIGGAVPFADTTPPAAMLTTLLDGQVPWVLTLAEKLARLKIAKTEVTARGGGVHELTVWVENTGSLPFPTAMGKRNQQPAPAVVTLEHRGRHAALGQGPDPDQGAGGAQGDQADLAGAGRPDRGRQGAARIGQRLERCGRGQGGRCPMRTPIAWLATLGLGLARGATRAGSGDEARGDQATPVHAVGQDHRAAALRRLLHLRAGRRGAAGPGRRLPGAREARGGRHDRGGARDLGDDRQQPQRPARRSPSPASTWTPTSTATRSRAARSACTCSTGCSPSTARTSRSPGSSTATPST